MHRAHSRTAAIQVAALVVASLLLAPIALAVEAFVFGFSPRTGDAFLDARLGDINLFIDGNLDGFVNDVVVSYGAPRTIVRSYVVERRWAPGDVYYGCALAAALRRPCIDVLRIYERDHAQGWGVIARRLGVRPGSQAFHALKGRVVTGHGRLKESHARGRNKDKNKGNRGGPPGQAGRGDDNPGRHGGQGQGHGRDR